MYEVFTRTWWRENPEWPGGLEPEVGNPVVIKIAHKRSDARAFCKKWNHMNPPCRHGRMAEFRKI